MSSINRSLIMRTVSGPADHREEFEAWQDRFAYDTLQLHGVQTARRLTQTGYPDSWLTYHDVDADRASDVLTDERQRLVDQRDSQRVLGLATQWDHQLYRGLAVPEVANPDNDLVASVVNFVWWTPRPGTENDLAAWYDEEHIPMLMSVPGWLRIRRYELVGDCGPRYLTIHDLQSPQVFGHPRQRAAQVTPWRAQVLADRLQFRVVGYTLARAI